MLKARQLSFTLLVVAHALSRVPHFHVATVLLFSQRDDEAEGLVDFPLRDWWAASSRSCLRPTAYYLAVWFYMAAVLCETTSARSLASPDGLLRNSSRATRRSFFAATPTLDSNLLLLANTGSPAERVFAATHILDSDMSLRFDHSH
jgi:hypothetical protein